MDYLNKIIEVCGEKSRVQEAEREFPIVLFHDVIPCIEDYYLEEWGLYLLCM